MRMRSTKFVKNSQNDWRDVGQPSSCNASLYDTDHRRADRAVLARTVIRRPRPSDPWFDTECHCRAAKRLTRRLERAAIAAAKKPDASAAASVNIRPARLSDGLTATCGIRSATHSGHTPSQLISRHLVYWGDQSICCYDEAGYQRATPSVSTSFTDFSLTK